MFLRTKPLVIALAATLAMVAGPGGTLAQDDVVGADSALPDLAPLDPPSTSERLCEEAGGAFGQGPFCTLPSAPLGLPAGMGRIFGRNVMGSSIAAQTPVELLAGASAAEATAAQRIDFVSKVGVKRKVRKALDRIAKRKGRATVSGNKAKWKSAGLIDIALAPDADDKTPLLDDWVVRVSSGDRIRDFGVIGGKDYVADENGRKQAGLALVDDSGVTLVIPGGVREAFAIDIARLDGDGNVIGQHIGGPGSPTARIPVDGTWPPILECAEYTADIDFDSSTDGVKYGLLGLGFVLETAILPPFATAENVTVDITLAPRGSRAKRAEVLTLEGLQPSGDVRRAIALDIDLSQQSLQGDSGYWLRERPYDISSLSLNLDTTTVAPNDPDAAISLLIEAGWEDAEADGIYTYESTDLAAEAQRFVGGDHTSRPLFYGEPSCGGDAFFRSIEDVCQLPGEADIPIWEERLGEGVDDLILQPGLFPGDLYGCTVLGPGNQLLSAFAVSPAYGSGETFDTAWVDWAERIDCAALSARPAVGSGTPSKVADCAASDFEIWADDEIGAWAYALAPGASLTPQETGAFINTFAARDADADGISDRHDSDLDGDGTADVDDRDDDGDGAPDDFDFTVRSAATFLSPGAAAELAEMAELLLRDR